MKKERIHGLGSSVGAGRSLDARQFISGAERRFSRRAVDACRPPARPEVGESIGHLLLPLPGPNGRAKRPRPARRRHFRISRKFYFPPRRRAHFSLTRPRRVV